MQSEATWLWAEEMSSPAVLTVVEIVVRPCAAFQAPDGSGEREGGGDVVDGRVPDGVDGHLIALPAGPGHEVGELGPVDIDHAAGVLQAQLGRVGLAHVRAARAHRPVGDHLERSLNQHRGAIGQVRCNPMRAAWTRSSRTCPSTSMEKR